MSKERELLERAIDAYDDKEEPYFERLHQAFEDIRTFLDAESEAEPFADSIPKGVLKWNPEAEPVAWPVDREWLRTVLRFAEKNPDYFYDVEPGFISLDSGDTDTIITALNKSAKPARKPMTEEEAIELCPFTREEFKAGFLTGIRFAEKHHFGIGGSDE